MLLIDLKTPHEKRMRAFSFAGIALAVLGVVVVGLGTAFVPVKASAPVSTTVGMEERQAVVLILDRIERKFPTLASDLAQVRLRSESELMEIRRLSPGTLVEITESEIALSPKFFEADSVEQEAGFLSAIRTELPKGLTPELARP